MNTELYNSIDKTELFMKVHDLWKKNTPYELTKEDIKILADNTTEFEQIRPERELIQKFFDNPDKDDVTNVVLYTATDVKDHIENMTKQKCYSNKIGQELCALKFHKKNYKINGKPSYRYRVRLIDTKSNGDSQLIPDEVF